MKILRLTALFILSLSLTACGGGPLTRLGVERVENYRSESISLNGAEGTVLLATENGNKKSLTFEDAKFDVLVNGTRIGVVRLRGAVTLPAGYSRTTVPIGIRYGRESVRGVLGLVLPTQQPKKKPEIRLQGKLSYRIAGSSKTQSISFNRRLDDRAIEYLESLCGGLF